MGVGRGGRRREGEGGGGRRREGREGEGASARVSRQPHGGRGAPRVQLAQKHPSPLNEGRTRVAHVVFQHLEMFSCFWVRVVTLPSWNLNKVQNKLLNKGILRSPGLHPIPWRGAGPDPRLLTTFPAASRRESHPRLPLAPSWWTSSRVSHSISIGPFFCPHNCAGKEGCFPNRSYLGLLNSSRPHVSRRSMIHQHAAGQGDKDPRQGQSSGAASPGAERAGRRHPCQRLSRVAGRGNEKYPRKNFFTVRCWEAPGVFH